MKSYPTNIVVATWNRLSKRTCKLRPVTSDAIHSYRATFVQRFHNKLLTAPKNSLLLLFLALGWNTFSLAADISNIDLKTVEIKNTIDKRKDLSPEQWRMLVFFARDTNPNLDSKYGHAYVAALKYRDDIQGFVTDSVFGLYPYEGKDWKLDFIDLDGSVDVKPADKYAEIVLLVWVNTSAYQQALSSREMMVNLRRLGHLN